MFTGPRWFKDGLWKSEDDIWLDPRGLVWCGDKNQLCDPACQLLGFMYQNWKWCQLNTSKHLQNTFASQLTGSWKNKSSWCRVLCVCRVFLLWLSFELRRMGDYYYYNILYILLCSLCLSCFLLWLLFWTKQTERAAEVWSWAPYGVVSGSGWCATFPSALIGHLFVSSLCSHCCF